MNDTIKNLILKAGFPKFDKMYVVSDGEELEKFAQLIVQECINRIETYQIPVGNSVSGELACEWTYDALKEIRDEIKETFGVK